MTLLNSIVHRKQEVLVGSLANSLGYLDPLMRHLKATFCWSSVHVQRSPNAELPSIWILLHHIVTVLVESCLALLRYRSCLASLPHTGRP